MKPFPAWDQVRRQGETAFVLRFGVIAIGVPLAFLLDLAVIAYRGEGQLLFTIRHAIELTYVLLIVAPLGGSLAGTWLWRRNERRSGHLALATFGAAGPATTTAPPRFTNPDREQLKLSALRDELAGLAVSSPDRLRRRAIGFVVLGYAYVVGVLLALVVATAILFRMNDRLAAQAAFFLGFFALTILLSLRVRLPIPDGKRITSAGSPRLFSALEDVTRTIDAPMPDRVLLTTDLNAAVTEQPRFGIFGMPKRYLLLGMPLLDALPSDELKAVLGHELAHLSRRDVRRLHWVGRMEVTWHVLASTLEAGRHWGRPLFLPFFRWYVPRLHTYARVVSRHDEHEADALAAQIAGGDAAACGLVRLHVGGHILTSRVLPSIFGGSAESAEPPPDAIDRMTRALRARWDENALRTDVRRALDDRSVDDDTHPSLAERVTRLTQLPDDRERLADRFVKQLQNAPTRRAAEDLLGRARAEALRSQLNADWQMDALGNWRLLHAAARVWKSPGAAEDASVHVRWARVRWAVDCESAKVAVTELRDFLAREPDHLEGAVSLGRLLLQSDNAEERAEGVARLEREVWRDSGLALVACAELEKEYARTGSRREIDGVQARAREIDQLLLATLAERSHLSADDAVSPYPLPKPTADSFRRALALEPAITRAYLVRKGTAHLAEQPCVVLGVEVDAPMHRNERTVAEEACQAVAGRLVMYETADLVVAPIERRSALRKKLESLAGAEVYRKH